MSRISIFSVTTLDCDSCRKFGDGGNEKCSGGYEFGGDRGDYSDSGQRRLCVSRKKKGDSDK